MLQSRALTILLVISWLFCGMVSILAGFAGIFYPVLSLLLLLPLIFLVLLGWVSLKYFAKLARFQKLLAILLIVIWLLHLLQVFVPETGFDAVWYHLPLAKLLSTQHQFLYQVDLYQTANPQFADSIFSLGFAALQSLGTKLVAYGFGLTLIALTYRLARRFLSRSWSLFAVISVSTFQVVAWQSASFYIDVAKACFELAGLWLLLESFFAKKKYVKKYLLLSAFAFSASLASKAFSILLLPALLYFYLRATKGKMRLLLPGVLLLLALPFYLFAQSYTGSFFFSTQVQASQLSALEYVWQQIVRLPYFFVSLFFTRDYTSPLLGLLPIALFSLRHSLVENKQLRFLSIFTLNQLAIWWFVPPLSTRYALAGFISGLLIVLVWLSQRKERFLPLLILALSLLLILPRIIVAQRSSTYLLGKQTKQEFITSQTDENNRSVLESWYQE